MIRKSPLSLPSPARGEGFQTPSLDGRGKGEGDSRMALSRLISTIQKP